MKTAKLRLWFFIYLQCFLSGTLVDSSTLPSSARPLTIMYKVGAHAVLPCSWRARLSEGGSSASHIQWLNPPTIVFERRGDDKWAADDLKGRAEVPEKSLESGNCSLIISNVQIADSGRYESFMVVEGARSKRTRVFIQSVKLSVTDHQSKYSRHPGESLVLELHTSYSFQVVFQARNSSEWSVLWMRGDENSQRLEKKPHHQELIMKNLQHSDEGTYKVLDEQGLSVSTVQLSVEGNSLAFRVAENLETPPTDAAAKSSCSDLLVVSVLVSSLRILRLL